jgi:hypothetical protein
VELTIFKPSKVVYVRELEETFGNIVAGTFKLICRLLHHLLIESSNNRCMACSLSHGATIAPSVYPVPLVSLQSYSYCMLTSSYQALEPYLASWTPDPTLLADLLSQTSLFTGGVDLLGASTDVSLYFTYTTVPTTLQTTSGIYPTQTYIPTLVTGASPPGQTTGSSGIETVFESTAKALMRGDVGYVPLLGSVLAIFFGVGMILL